MVFHVLTLFPQMIIDAASHSILGRAVKSGIIRINCVDIRQFAVNRHGQVDDAPYGGGSGMVMMAQPVYDAYKSLGTDSRAIYLSPKGRVFNQAVAEELAMRDEVVLLCGHYEGLDLRVVEELKADELSVGDYVLTGGEIAALAVIDATSRLLPGVLGKDESSRDESFSKNGRLEHPHYTRPPVFMGRPVPEVLLSGNHKKIEEWRFMKSVEITRSKRPELLEGTN